MTGPHTGAAAALLQQAVALHQRGQLDAAQALYRQVLTLDPRQFDALHLSGVIAQQQGRAQQAVELIAQAIAVAPSQPAPHCNLGAALQDLDLTQEALASYERAIALHPDYALAYCNRGNALRKLGRADEALRSYQRALLLRPGYPEAACHRAIVLNDAGRAEAHCWRATAMQRLDYHDDALAGYDRAIALRPRYPLAHQYRGNALRSLGRDADAIAAYREALAQGADAQHITYVLAAFGDADMPTGAPDDYVKTLFDNYADHFDRHLLDTLAYRTPALLDAAIRRHVAGDALDTLDLGCGTGLFAPYLREYSRTLDGVDLSPKMLDKARRRGVYDQLACAELGAFLAAQNGRYDLIVAADVFVYIGDLAPVFAQVHRVLRPHGGFCFSVEASQDEEEVALGSSRRYAHSLPYLRRLADAHGFELLEAERQAGRRENDVDVMSYAVYLRRLHTAAV